MKQKTLREDAHSREAETCRKRPRETPECAKAHSFSQQVLADASHSNIDKNKIPVLRYRKLKTAWNDDIRLKISCL